MTEKRRLERKAMEAELRIWIAAVSAFLWLVVLAGLFSIAASSSGGDFQINVNSVVDNGGGYD